MEIEKLKGNIMNHEMSNNTSVLKWVHNWRKINDLKIEDQRQKDMDEGKTGNGKNRMFQ